MRLFFILLGFFFFYNAQAESKFTLIYKAKDLLSKEEMAVMAKAYIKNNNILDESKLTFHPSKKGPFFALYQQEENKPHFLKLFGWKGRQLQYTINDTIHSVTEYDLSLLAPNNLLNKYDNLYEYPSYLMPKPLTLALEEAQEKRLNNDFTPVGSNISLKPLAKGETVPIITKEQLKKTNNMTLYLSYHFNEKGEKATLTLAPGYYGAPIGKIPNGYSKKINIIKDYQTIGKQLSTMQMTELKGKFAITEMEAHFALMLQKDTEVMYPLYFCNYSKDEWVIVNFDTRKVYLLNEKDNDNLVKLLQSLLIRKDAQKINYIRYGK